MLSNNVLVLEYSKSLNHIKRSHDKQLLFLSCGADSIPTMNIIEYEEYGKNAFNEIQTKYITWASNSLIHTAFFATVVVSFTAYLITFYFFT